jgi:hypothetical protein
MAAPRKAARYSGSGGRHDVLVSRDPGGRWQILDAAGADLVEVDTLTGHDDRLDQALALACDYAAEKQAYADGRRDTDPWPAASRSASAGGSSTIRRDSASSRGE